jgi:hypothetical protein
MSIELLRVFLGMIGGLVFFVGLISVGAMWMSNDPGNPPWIMLVVGALMWVQAQPILRRGEDREALKLFRERRDEERKKR